MSVATVPEPIFVSLEKKMAVIERAKSAYLTWAFRVGELRPWEHLSNSEQYAWFEVVAFVQAEIEDEGYYCTCGEPLLCASCDEGTCTDCKTDMVCPKCDDLKCVKCDTDLVCPRCICAALEAKKKPAAGKGLTS